jgi:hypothetical protein
VPLERSADRIACERIPQPNGLVATSRGHDGAAGGILAAELAKAEMKVIGLERGPHLTTQDFNAHDESRYFPASRPAAKPVPEKSGVIAVAHWSTKGCAPIGL